MMQAFEKFDSKEMNKQLDSMGVNPVEVRSLPSWGWQPA